MLSEQKKLLLKAIEFIDIGKQQALLVIESQPDDSKALDAALRMIESECAFIRQYANTPRASGGRTHDGELG